MESQILAKELEDISNGLKTIVVTKDQANVLNESAKTAKRLNAFYFRMQAFIMAVEATGMDSSESKSCSELRDDSKKFLAVATTIRDTVHNIYQSILKLPTLQGLAETYSNLVVELDELVEDLTISCDEEFNDLITKLADTI